MKGGLGKGNGGRRLEDRDRKDEGQWEGKVRDNELGGFCRKKDFITGVDQRETELLCVTKGS